MAVRKDKATVLAAALVAGLVIAPASYAATMNFDALPDAGQGNAFYSEDGITVMSPSITSVGWWNEPGAVHLSNPANIDQTDALHFTMSGLFNAVSLDVWSYGLEFLEQGKTLEWELPPVLIVTGFLGGQTVASASYKVGANYGQGLSILLGDAFSGLDLLRLELALPCNSAGCPVGIEIDVDNVTLDAAAPAPVPLPATGALLGAAGLGLWGIRRRRRISAAA